MELPGWLWILYDCFPIRLAGVGIVLKIDLPCGWDFSSGQGQGSVGPQGLDLYNILSGTLFCTKSLSRILPGCRGLFHVE